MDERILRELELWPVARLYGLEGAATRADPDPAVPDAAARRVPTSSDAQARGGALRMMRIEPAHWLVVGAEGCFEGEAARLLEAMLAAVGLRSSPHVAFDAAQAGSVAVALAMGEAAASVLVGSGGALATLRGRMHRFGEVPVVATFEPAHLLRNAGDKPLAWEDLLLARRAASG